MDEDQKGRGSVSWTNLMALVVALVGGVSIFFEPLVTSRPQRGSRNVEAIAEQDVDAALWQDPLRVAIEHFEKAAAEKSGAIKRSSEHLAALKKEVQEHKPAEDPKTLLILPVMIPGGPYGENYERRLRTRQAVVSGLAASGFTPNDGERIGYFLLPDPKLPDESPDATDEGFFFCFSGAARTPGASLGVKALSSTVVPFEWFAPRYDDKRFSKPAVERVLIVWLRDDVPGTDPLTAIRNLGETLDWNGALQTVAVLGPGTSSGLAKFFREDAKLPADHRTARTLGENVGPDVSKSSSSRLRGVTFYAATPTAAPDVVALTSPKNYGANFTALNCGAKLYRTINTDDLVADVLIEELNRRNVDLRKNIALAAVQAKHRSACREDGKDPGFEHVAVIAEWDTVYGRSLPLTFLKEIYKIRNDSLKPGKFMEQKGGRLSSGCVPEWFHSFTYLRGIDGRPMGESSPEKSKAAQGKESTAASPPRVATEGEDQSDYLLRLAAQLAAEHHELQRQGGAGLKAVGILGSDVYDKLMILRALRSELPGVLFFTNNLDARLGLEEEWHATHNLIVASPFGLSLAPEFQRNIAPFRDSYQTSVFASTLMSTGVLPIPAFGKTMPPRIFEIGRHGPWDLSESARSFDPPRLDVLPWLGTPQRKAFLLLVGVGFLGGLLWIVLTVGWVGLSVERGNGGARRWDWKSIVRTLFADSSIATVLAVGVSALSVWVVYFRQRAEGEPLAFAEGISIWPTEMVRGIVIILCLHFAVKGRLALSKSDAEIKDKHRLGAPRDLPAPKRRRKWSRVRKLWVRFRRELRATCRRIVQCRFGWQTRCLGAPPKNRDVSVPENLADEAAPRTFQAQILWEEYLKRGRRSRRWRRFGPLILFYLVGGIALFFLLGFPSVPARGTSSFVCDRVLFVLTILAAITLLFYVVDAIRLNRDLIEVFNQGVTVWPPPAWQKNPRHPMLSEKDLAEYLDIRLIAARTEVICPLVNYPFVILVLVVLARNSYFDNWDWPPSLIAILAVNLAWAIHCSVGLYGAARKARRTAVDRLSNHRLEALHLVGVAKSDEEREHLKTRVKLIEETSAEITALRRGAFAPLSDQPFFRAILFSSGGIGLGSLVQFLPRLF